MTFAFTIRHGEAGLRTLYRAWWRAVHGRASAAAFALATAFAFAWLVAPAVRTFATAGVVLCAGFVALIQTAREQTVRRALDHLRRVPGGAFDYLATDASLLEQSALGRVELPWARFTRTREVAGYLLLQLGPPREPQFVALPLDQLPEGAAAFLAQRVAAGEASAGAPGTSTSG